MPSNNGDSVLVSVNYVKDKYVRGFFFIQLQHEVYTIKLMKTSLKKKYGWVIIITLNNFVIYIFLPVK